MEDVEAIGVIAGILHDADGEVDYIDDEPVFISVRDGDKPGTWTVLLSGCTMAVATVAVTAVEDGQP